MFLISALLIKMEEQLDQNSQGCVMENHPQHQNPSICSEIFVSHVIPFFSEENVKEQVLQAVKTRSLENLYFLLGCTPTTVPGYLIEDDQYAQAADLTIMLPVLERLGFHLSRQVFEAAAKRGNLEAMKWLQQHGCPWDWQTYRAAAVNGNVKNMMWLKQLEMSTKQ
jgi:hypothetical protein